MQENGRYWRSLPIQIGIPARNSAVISCGRRSRRERRAVRIDLPSGRLLLHRSFASASQEVKSSPITICHANVTNCNYILPGTRWDSTCVSSKKRFRFLCWNNFPWHRPLARLHSSRASSSCHQAGCKLKCVSIELSSTTARKWQCMSLSPTAATGRSVKSNANCIKCHSSLSPPARDGRLFSAWKPPKAVRFHPELLSKEYKSIDFIRLFNFNTIVYLEQTYTLVAKQQPHRSNENLVFEASSNRGEKERLSATTIFPYTDPKEGFAIMVSYEAKVIIINAWCNQILINNIIIDGNVYIDQSIHGRRAVPVGSFHLGWSVSPCPFLLIPSDSQRWCRERRRRSSGSSSPRRSGEATDGQVYSKTIVPLFTIDR